MSEGICHKHKDVSALIAFSLKKLATFHSYEHVPFFDLVDAAGHTMGQRAAFVPGSDTFDPHNIRTDLADSEFGAFTLVDRQHIKVGEFHLGKVKSALASDTLVVCQDYASADLINLVSTKTTLVAFHHDNLVPVARAVRTAHPDAKLFVCADTGPNPTLAQSLADLDATLLQPSFLQTDKDRSPCASFYDFALLYGLTPMNLLLGDLTRDFYEFYLAETPAAQCLQDTLDAFDGYKTTLDSFDAACTPLPSGIPLFNSQAGLTTSVPSDGCFSVLDRFGSDLPSTLATAPDLYLAPDFPSANSINLALRKPVAIAFAPDNLKSAAAALHHANRSAQINFCLPADKAPAVDTNFLAAVNGRVLSPTFTLREQKDGLTTFFDLHQARGGTPLVNQLWVQARSRSPETQLSLEKR